MGRAAATVSAGETGTVAERVAAVGGLRTRLVEFSSNYRGALTGSGTPGYCRPGDTIV